MRALFVSVTAILLIATTSCKKKVSPYTAMTVNVAGDSSWTATSVTTENDNAIVYIYGENVALDKRVYLTLNHYESGNRTYTIGNIGTHPSNTSQSGAQYQSGGNLEEATGGQ